MDNEKQNTSTPSSNPNTKQGESKRIRNEEPVEQTERLWKHESEIPDASNKPTGSMGSGQRRDNN